MFLFREKQSSSIQESVIYFTKKSLPRWETLFLHCLSSKLESSSRKSFLVLSQLILANIYLRGVAWVIPWGNPLYGWPSLKSFNVIVWKRSRCIRQASLTRSTPTCDKNNNINQLSGNIFYSLCIHLHIHSSSIVLLPPETPEALLPSLEALEVVHTRRRHRVLLSSLLVSK